MIGVPKFLSVEQQQAQVAVLRSLLIFNYYRVIDTYCTDGSPILTYLTDVEDKHDTEQYIYFHYKGYCIENG